MYNVLCYFLDLTDLLIEDINTNYYCNSVHVDDPDLNTKSYTSHPPSGKEHS